MHWNLKDRDKSADEARKLTQGAKAELSGKVNVSCHCQSNYDPYIEKKRNTIVQKYNINGTPGATPTPASCGHEMGLL